jgi:hypothetical protein
MTIEKIKKQFLTLRTRQQLVLEDMDRLIAEIEKSVPSGEPRKRRDLKQGRKLEAENRLIEKGVFNQNFVTDKTLKL